MTENRYHPSTPEEVAEYNDAMEYLAQKHEEETRDPEPEDFWREEMDAMEEQEFRSREAIAYDEDYHIYPNQY